MNRRTAEFRRSTTIVSDAVAAGQVAGAQLCVSVGGEPVLDLATGSARRGVPMTSSTLVRWGCAAKPTMGYGIVKLVEQGDLHLDATVASFVPEFAKHGKDAYTIADLLTHNVPYDELVLDQRLADLILEVLFSRTAQLDADRVLALVCDAELVPPSSRAGDGGGYSLASNFFLLAEIVRSIGWRPEDFLRTAVYEPLGMVDTWPALDEDVVGRYEPGDFGAMYITRPNRQRQLHPFSAVDSLQVTGLCAPGSSVWGPGRDLARFYSGALAALGGASSELSETSASGWLTPRRGPGWESTYGAFQAWGLGVQTMMWPLYGGSVSFDAFGHDGFSSTFGLADPSLDLVIVFASNTVIEDHFSLWRSITDAVYDELGVDRSPFNRAASAGRPIPAWARPDGSLIGLCPCGRCAVTTDVLDPVLPCARAAVRDRRGTR
jgi:CubicO group peptidase (beta-lactamase class C family)